MSAGHRASVMSNAGSLQNPELFVKPPLLGGETTKETYRDLTYLCPYSGHIKGILILTNYRIYFQSFQSSPAAAAMDEDGHGGGGGETDQGDYLPTVLDVPLGFISRLDKMGGQKTSKESSYGIEIVCKDIRTLRQAITILSAF